MTTPPARDPDGHLRVILRTLELDFGVDVSAATHLRGQDLSDWIDAADDVLFAVQLAAQRISSPERLN
jgi:hypothetical protein